jgi:hypothetical protein
LNTSVSAIIVFTIVEFITTEFISIGKCRNSGLVVAGSLKHGRAGTFVGGCSEVQPNTVPLKFFIQVTTSKLFCTGSCLMAFSIISVYMLTSTMTLYGAASCWQRKTSFSRWTVFTRGIQMELQLYSFQLDPMDLDRDLECRSGFHIQI